MIWWCVHFCTKRFSLCQEIDNWLFDKCFLSILIKSHTAIQIFLNFLMSSMITVYEFSSLHTDHGETEAFLWSRCWQCHTPWPCHSQSPHQVWALDGGQVVCDHNTGVASPGFAQGFLDELFTFCIHNWCCFLPKKHVKLCDRLHAVPLPTAQQRSSFVSSSAVVFTIPFHVEFSMWSKACVHFKHYFAHGYPVFSTPSSEETLNTQSWCLCIMFVNAQV